MTSSVPTDTGCAAVADRSSPRSSRGWSVGSSSAWIRSSTRGGGAVGRRGRASGRVSAAQSAVMDSKGAKMARREFSPQGRIAQSAKDFTLILDGAAAAGQGLPFARTYLQMMQAALAAGEGDLDNAAVLLPISRSRPE